MIEGNLHVVHMKCSRGWACAAIREFCQRGCHITGLSVHSISNWTLWKNPETPCAFLCFRLPFIEQLSACRTSYTAPNSMDSGIACTQGSDLGVKCTSECMIRFAGQHISTGQLQFRSRETWISSTSDARIPRNKAEYTW